VKRMLVVITRMYAGGGRPDEFAESWAGPGEEDLPHLIFPRRREEYTPLVLVIHGRDYPDGQASVARAADAIQAALEAEGELGFDEMGVAFHLPSRWGKHDQASVFTRGLRAALDYEYRPVFVRHYAGGTLDLAPLCRDGDGISAEFDRQWQAFVSGASDFDSRLGTREHKLVNELSGLDAEIQRWRESGYAAGHWREMLGTYGDKARYGFDEARRLMVESWWYRDGVAGVVEDIMLDPRPEGGKRKIREKFESLKALFDPSDERYRPVEEIVAAVAGEVDEDEACERLRALLAEKNHFSRWYHSVLSALHELREEVRHWSGS
jgi:hypothetical protein